MDRRAAIGSLKQTMQRYAGQVRAMTEIPPPATFRTSASGRPLIVRAGQAPAAAAATAGPGLQVDLLGKLQGVIELDAKVSHCAIQLAVTE